MTDKKKRSLNITPPGASPEADRTAGTASAPPKSAAASPPASTKDRFIDEARWSRRKREEKPSPDSPPRIPPSVPSLIPEPWGSVWKAALDFQMGLLRNAGRFSPVGMALDLRLWSGALDAAIRDMASDDPEKESRVVHHAASYGTQLNAIMDVLDGLVDRLAPEETGSGDAEELRRAIARFRELKERITAV